MAKIIQTIFALSVVISVCCELDLLILHNNDMHARFEETERNTGTCKPKNRNKNCVGGFARTAHEIRRYRKLAQDGKGPEVLYLNAGDTFVGTSWFGVYKWNISQAFINILHPDVMCLGNHEFDNGISGLAPFVNAVQSPIVCANVDFRNEPSLSKVQKSVVLERSGMKIGIVGHLTQETKAISVTEKAIFLDEVESVKAETERLDALGVKIIIVLGHSGYLIDQRIAAEVPLVDVVVGGHTNTFLWNGPKPDTEEIVDLYPKVVVQKSGKKVPVVQAYAYTKYLGRLNVTFDDNGDLTYFAGQPELLDVSIPQDADVLALLDLYRPKIDELFTQKVGSTKVVLDGNPLSCREKECNFGDLIADAFVMYKASISTQKWTEAPIGLYNAGAIRNTIDPQDGIITKGDVLGAMPYGNQVITLKLKGYDLLKTLEIAVRSNGETSFGEFLQVSGLRVVYDRSKPTGHRVVSVKVRCGNCSIPTYDYIDVNKNYTIITSSFIAVDAGDAHTVLTEKSFDKVTEDLLEDEVVTWYLERYSPVYPEIQGRISFVPESDSGKASFAVKLYPNILSVLVICILYFIK